MRDRQLNLERFIVFQMVILKQARYVTTSHATQRRIGKRLDAWEAGHHGMLVDDTLCMCAQYLTVARREESDDHQSQTYHSLVLGGNLRMSVRWITDRETGGVLQPGERCKKTGERVM